MARLGWVALFGLLALGAAASDSGLSAQQQLDLWERVERLERDVARLKTSCHVGEATGSLRSEDYGGHGTGGGNMNNQPQLSPQQQQELMNATEKLRQQAEQYKNVLQQLENGK